MLNKGISPPKGVKESCMELTAPQEASVVTVAKRAELKIPKRTSFPSIFPPAGSTPRACSRGLPAPSAHQQIKNAPRKRIAMAPQTAQPCFWFFTIRPEIIGEAARDEEDGEHLNEVGQRRRVLIGMGGIGIEKTAAVCSQHLDGHLGGHRALGDGLGFNLLFFHHRISSGILDFLTGRILFWNLDGGRFDQSAPSRKA